MTCHCKSTNSHLTGSTVAQVQMANTSSSLRNTLKTPSPWGLGPAKVWVVALSSVSKQGPRGRDLLWLLDCEAELNLSPLSFLPEPSILRFITNCWQVWRECLAPRLSYYWVRYIVDLQCCCLPLVGALPRSLRSWLVGSLPGHLAHSRDLLFQPCY